MEREKEGETVASGEFRDTELEEGSTSLIARTFRNKSHSGGQNNVQESLEQAQNVLRCCVLNVMICHAVHAILKPTSIRCVS